MAQLQTVLKVIDNTGVKKIRVFQPYRSTVASLGSIVVGAVVSTTAKAGSMTKGTIVRGMLVNDTQWTNRKSGVQLRYPQKGIVLMRKKLGKLEFIASRVTTSIPRELRSVAAKAMSKSHGPI